MARELNHINLCVLIFLHFQCSAAILLDPTVSTIEQLYSGHLIKEGQQLKLHLGCGRSHFNGYVNIDFPPSEHTVQTTSGADVFGDIRALNFPECSVDEIRSHHVFEHFVRPDALALLCKWHTWLKIGGTLIIETPDLEKCVVMINDKNYSYDQKQVIIRHMFGSHEASWAIHCDGWYR